MIPTTFPESNLVYKKPEGITDEQCYDLPVFKGTDESGLPVIVSCWKFSKEDLEDIQRTGVIYLQIVTNTQPMVALYTENPFH